MEHESLKVQTFPETVIPDRKRPLRSEPNILTVNFSLRNMTNNVLYISGPLSEKVSRIYLLTRYDTEYSCQYSYSTEKTI